jgi:hypothetical protein
MQPVDPEWPDAPDCETPPISKSEKRMPVIRGREARLSYRERVGRKSRFVAQERFRTNSEDERLETCPVRLGQVLDDKEEAVGETES